MKRIPIEPYIGRRYRKVRETKGLSTYQVAKLSNTSQSKISKFENGLFKTMDVDTLKQMCKVIGLSSAYDLWEMGCDNGCNLVPVQWECRVCGATTKEKNGS